MTRARYYSTSENNYYNSIPISHCVAPIYGPPTHQLEPTHWQRTIGCQEAKQVLIIQIANKCIDDLNLYLKRSMKIKNRSEYPKLKQTNLEQNVQNISQLKSA